MMPFKKTTIIFFLALIIGTTTALAEENSIDYSQVTASDTYAAVNGFFEGQAIEEIVIAEKVLLEEKSYIVDRIRQNAFNGETVLQIVKMPDSITYVGKKCFYGCSNLREVYLSKQLKKIYPYLFYGCEKLIGIELPLSVTDIGKSAFQKTGLTEMIIPENITKIGSMAFRDCKNLQSVYFAHQEKLPEFSETDLIFTGCTNLQHISVATEEMAEKIRTCLASMKNVNPQIEVRNLSEEPEVIPPVEEEKKEPEVIPPVEEEEKEPEVIPPVEEEEKEPEVVPPVEEEEKEPEVVPPVEEEEKEPEIIPPVEEEEKEPEVIPPVEEEEKEPEVIPQVEEEKEEIVVISSNKKNSYVWRQEPQKISREYRQAVFNWLREWYREWQEYETLVRKLHQKYLIANGQQLLLPHYIEVGTFQ